LAIDTVETESADKRRVVKTKDLFIIKDSL
jgi:hypothetical protein